MAFVQSKLADNRRADAAEDVSTLRSHGDIRACSTKSVRGSAVDVVLKNVSSHPDFWVGGVRTRREEGEPAPAMPILVDMDDDSGAVVLFIRGVVEQTNQRDEEGEEEEEDDEEEDSETLASVVGKERSSRTATTSCLQDLTATNHRMAFRLDPLCGKLFLERFHVEKENRGKGIGRQCMAVLLAFASNLYPGLPVYVTTATREGAAFYAKVGWRQDAQCRKDLVYYTQSNEDKDDGGGDGGGGSGGGSSGSGGGCSDDDDGDDDDDDEEGRR
jgi:GNAT superfamily N-acetyltransferase